MNDANPQAFPHGDPTHGGDIGMTLRDWFAGQALPEALLSTEALVSSGKVAFLNAPAAAARAAYAIADAMLAVRAELEKEKP